MKVHLGIGVIIAPRWHLDDFDFALNHEVSRRGTVGS